jgi:hypothetical protein
MNNEDKDNPERTQVRRSDHQRRNEQQSLLIKQELERMRRSPRITTSVERVSRDRPTDPESAKNR